MAGTKLQRIARIRERITIETYQQALRAVIAGGQAVPGLSPEYLSAIARDYRKGGYTALWICPECWSEGVVDLQNVPVLHRLLPEEKREALIPAMEEARRTGDEAAIRAIMDEVGRLCVELQLPRIDAAWLCLVCVTEFGERDIDECGHCGELTTDTDSGLCDNCWER
ncbi:hypothetical protein ACFVFS_14950 [Kitasatospora sp. NPDC057692]|uniref:hypothetical protein n=1 Tax=Kitasatospora sp. NPDC057692 TaxID=3346215 RepID=UPI0036C288C4